MLVPGFDLHRRRSCRLKAVQIAVMPVLEYRYRHSQVLSRDILFEEGRLRVLY